MKLEFKSEKAAEAMINCLNRNDPYGVYTMSETDGTYIVTITKSTVIDSSDKSDPLQIYKNHAESIRAAVAVLNSAIKDAAKIGLQVSIDTITDYGLHGERTIVYHKTHLNFDE